MRYKKPFTIYKRGKVWYYRLPEDNKRVGHSTGQKLKYKAEEHVKALLNTSSPDIPTLSEYAGDIFDWNKSTYLRHRSELKRGRKISPETARNRHGNVHKHLIPQFGDRLLNEITIVEFEAWLMNLKLSNSSKNCIIYTISLIMREAVRQNIIEHSPLIEMAAVDPSCRVRDYLRLSELNQLFPKDIPEFEKVWKHDVGYGVTLLISASGGLRSGELRALRWKHVVWETGGVLVMRARKSITGEGEPKANGIRGVLLPERTMAMLKWWYELNHQPPPEIYISPCIASEPLLKALKRGMDTVGIDHHTRYLDVHSLRHTYNSQMRGILDDNTLRAFTGHRTLKMLEHYDQKTVAEKLQRRIGLRGQVNQFFEGGNDIEQQ